MTPATSQSPKNIRKQIGPAIWLLALLARFTPAEWTGDDSTWVSGGNVVSDAELAERLGASQRTIAKWRLRLGKVGALGWHIAPGGRVYWIAAVNRVFAPLSQPRSAEREPAGESVAVNTEAVVSVPLASKWLQ
jgi:hypothetical protein